ncbi:MAG: hypothetical protein IS860_11300 [Nitrosopumilus sp.]|nr:hypothetical protein [Nitrosopumilus sp.]MCE2507521.1 hypothetical protein [Nitrosopumilaceae archaeon]
MQKIIIIIGIIIIATVGLSIVLNETNEGKNNYFEIDSENGSYLFLYFSSSGSSIVKNPLFEKNSNTLTFNLSSDVNEKFTIIIKEDFIKNEMPEDGEFDPLVLIDGLEVAPIFGYKDGNVSISFDVYPKEQKIIIPMFTFH